MYGHTSIHPSIHSIMYGQPISRIITIAIHLHTVQLLVHCALRNVPCFMNPASLSSALSPRDPRSSLRTLVLYYMQALRKEVVLPSTRIAKMGNLLHSTV
ncbi:hypothetical protein EJ02DRAFT_459283, partial [Clathrospora elynae]